MFEKTRVPHIPQLTAEKASFAEASFAEASFAEASFAEASRTQTRSQPPAQRHNGVGLKRLGFIEAAFRLSSKFPQYFPHWLDTEKFQNDLDLFNAIRSLVEVCRTLKEKA